MFLDGQKSSSRILKAIKKVKKNLKSVIQEYNSKNFKDSTNFPITLCAEDVKDATKPVFEKLEDEVHIHYYP